MERRTHLRDFGCIACDVLEQVGVGKEGWLVENPSLLITLKSNYLAFARISLILILSWKNDSFSSSSPVKIRPSLSSTEEGEITVIQWLISDDLRILALGASNGYLLIYSICRR
ncbi:hypothetical protein MRB53_024273 [Persea americana]|uniref:Uncharacterized protein n=1 Tax=Persea americana TaxID=3435 RepID=A0ACC2LCH4_PERAE|nr:hypothetical protein MRB53_024273 [Persea americana]